MSVAEVVVPVVFVDVVVAAASVFHVFSVHYGPEHLACIKATALTPYGSHAVCSSGFSPSALVASALRML